MVGCPQDLSTTFYNPGGLAHLETESFLLSAQAFEYQWLSARESSGRFEDLSSDRFGTAPSLFAGTFPRSWTKGTLAYSLLTRQRFEFRIDNWRGEVATSPLDSVATNTFIDARASEHWGGLTWARNVGDVGVGATVYGAHRSQRGRTELLSQPTPTGTPGTALAVVNDFNYWHFRLLAKIGVYWDRDRTSLGITVTTPGVGLFGDGKAAFYRSVVPIDSIAMLPTITEVVVANDPSVNYESPVSVAIGARYEVGRNALYATFEWFDAVGRYRVLDAPSVPESGLGSSLGSQITHEQSSVANFAIGYEYSPHEKLTFYGSFLTDFSSATNDPGAGLSFSTWDIFQITGGAAFTFQNMDFTLGASFAGGGETIERQNEVGITPVLDPVEVRYRRIKVFIGFEFAK